MKSLLIYFLIIFLTHLPLQTLFAQQPSGIAVVELFTSEGCSSCPSAENVVMEIAGENNINIYILEFHVDYWDRLGWKDPFSNAAYSKRQQTYGRKLALANIYTPQIIVNGSIELVGSDKVRLEKNIGVELLKSQAPIVAIKAKRAETNAVSISYKIDGGSGNILNIALIQLQANSDVESGENKGRRLHHIQIVRTFKTIEDPGSTGEISLSIPDGLIPGNSRVIAYLQNKNDWHIKGAVQSASF